MRDVLTCAAYPHPEMLELWRNLGHGLATCLLCGAPGAAGLDVCAGCWADLPRNHHSCPSCALPLPIGTPPDQSCGACQRHPPPYMRCFAPFQYAGLLPHLITGLKFQARLTYARLLGELLTQALLERGQPWPELLLPVPLHSSRLRERGFNQALELARFPARALGLRLETKRCVRRLNTPPQVGLVAAARRNNLRGAFALTAPLDVWHVALVDDVVTTGSTVAELAGLLRQAGVARVEVWAVAKTAAPG